MSWIYSGTIVEDEKRYTAPPEITGGDEDEADLPPYDRGYEDRFCCLERKPPRYWHESSKTEWLRGWDTADSECKEGVL